MDRRGLLFAGATIGAPWVWRAAVAASGREPTPAQAEGPFYPVEFPTDSDSDLLANGVRHYAGGTPATVIGTVLDTAGRAVAGAAVEIWQCDAAGHYHHPGDGGRADPAFQGFGRVAVDASGAWRFRTIRPAPYSGRTPHIHLKVRLGVHTLLTTQLYVQGEPGNARDGLWRALSPAARERLTVPFEAVPGGLQARFPIVVDV